MRISLLATLVAATFWCAPAAAQSVVDSFGDVRLQTGADVAVITRSGSELHGRVREISEAGLRLDIDGQVRDVAASGTLRIDRVGDPVWEGLGAGAAAGLGLGLVVAVTCDACETGVKALGVIAYSGIGAGVGALFNLAVRGRTSVFAAPGASSTHWTVSPRLSRGRQELALTMRF